MTHTTTPPASGAAQMRKACVAKLTEMANDAERNAENNPGGQFADRKFVAMHVIRIAADAIRTLPLPVDPHAEQIAALTEARAVATEALRLYADCGFGMARTALARIEAIGGKDD